MAFGARYVESQRGMGPPVLSPLYAHAIGSLIPGKKPDLTPALRPSRFYEFSEATAVWITFSIGLALAVISAFFSFKLLRQGYDVWAFLGIVLGLSSSVIWDIAIGTLLAFAYLVWGAYAKLTADA